MIPTNLSKSTNFRHLVAFYRIQSTKGSLPVATVFHMEQRQSLVPLKRKTLTSHGFSRLDRDRWKRAGREPQAATPRLKERPQSSTLEMHFPSLWLLCPTPWRRFSGIASYGLAPVRTPGKRRGPVFVAISGGWTSRGHEYVFDRWITRRAPLTLTRNESATRKHTEWKGKRARERDRALVTNDAAAPNR